jgi:hypothetical protein
MDIKQDIKLKTIENKIVWRGHALKRMMERDISRGGSKNRDPGLHHC